jgi:RNA polymerase subunit RPABC4/transcription elongation factor Spt4
VEYIEKLIKCKNCKGIYDMNEAEACGDTPYGTHSETICPDCGFSNFVHNF